VSRIINIDSTGKQRGQLTRAVAMALRQLSQQTEFGAEARDLAAFIALALQTVHAGIDSSVAAWEKRGYWVKADRFRMEWAWTGATSERMRAAVLTDDWTTVAQISMQAAQRLDGVQVSAGSRIGQPWKGAFDRLKAAA
jgi:hypothetical protein